MKSPEASDQHTGPLKDVFRQKLEGLKATPSDHLWERLELNLDREQVSRDQSLTRLFLRLAAVLLLLLLSVGGFLTFQYFQAPTGEIAIQTEKPGAPGVAEKSASNTAVTNPRAPGISDSQATGNTYAVSSSTNSATKNSLAYQQQSKEKAEAAIRQKTIVSPDLKGNLPALNGAVSRVRKNKAAIKKDTWHTGHSAVALARTGVPGKNSAKSPRTATPEPSVTQATTSREVSNGSEVNEPTNSPIESSRVAAVAEQGKNFGQNKKGKDEPAISSATDPSNVIAAKDSLPKSDSSTVAQLPVLDSVTVKKDSVKAVTPFGWSVSALAGPVYFQQNIVFGTSRPATPPGMMTTQSVSHYEEATKEFNANTNPEASFQAGLLLGKNLNSFLKLEAGVSYGRYQAGSELSFLVTDSIKIRPIVPEPQTYSLLLPAMLTDENVYENKSLVRTAKYQVKYEYRYLSFPVQLQAFRDFRKWRNFVTVGVQANKLLESHITTNQPDIQNLFLTENSNVFFRSMQWSVMGSAGVGYLLSPHFLIQGSGTVNRSLAPITKAEHIQGTRQKNPQTLGANLSVAYLFGK